MKKYGDNGGQLAKYLGITRGTFSLKLNEKNGAEFTNKEMIKIKERYKLTPDQVDLIFF